MQRKLNEEQEAILKDVIKTKKLALHKPLFLFLTGGAGTGKTYTKKVICDALITLYDKQLGSDPLKPKDLFIASIGKACLQLRWSHCSLNSSPTMQLFKTNTIRFLYTRYLDQKSRHHSLALQFYIT